MGLCKTPLKLLILPTRKCQKSLEKSNNLKIVDVAYVQKQILPLCSRWSKSSKKQRGFPILWEFPIIMSNVVIDLK